MSKLGGCTYINGRVEIQSLLSALGAPLTLTKPVGPLGFLRGSLPQSDVNKNLGGGNSKILDFHPENRGR